MISSLEGGNSLKTENEYVGIEYILLNQQDSTSLLLYSLSRLDKSGQELSNSHSLIFSVYYKLKHIRPK